MITENQKQGFKQGIYYMIDVGRIKALQEEMCFIVLGSDVSSSEKLEKRLDKCKSQMVESYRRVKAYENLYGFKQAIISTEPLVANFWHNYSRLRKKVIAEEDPVPVVS